MISGYGEYLVRIFDQLTEHQFWLKKLHQKIGCDLLDGDVEDLSLQCEGVAEQNVEVTELKTMLEPIAKRFRRP